MTPDELANRLLDFAARIGKLADSLPETRLGRHVANQIIRSGTSPAPNYEEGRAAESRRDFVHKLSISLKELRETRYWLQLTVRSGLIPETKLVDLLDEADQLCRILGQSLATTRNGIRDKRAEPQPAPSPPK